MFLALGLGAYEVAVFHVITHAFFKASLFLGSDLLFMLCTENKTCAKWVVKSNDNYIHNLLISSLAISGIPPSGFFSKDEILLVAFEHNKILWFIASLASLMTAFYMFRLYLTFFKEFRGTAEQKSFT
jgi:NADH-quinone oxidoreductase subunit L